MSSTRRNTPRQIALRRLIAILALSWGMAACGDPCRELSEKICSCLSTYYARKSCNERIAALAGQFNTNPTSPNWLNAQEAAQGRNTCAQLLGSCTCEALQNGDLQACGLANEASGL